MCEVKEFTPLYFVKIFAFVLHQGSKKVMSKEENKYVSVVFNSNES